ncbi:hypothetical protein VTO42DRAFT_1252 [Malbranchea cinnamomea]
MGPWVPRRRRGHCVDTYALGEVIYIVQTAFSGEAVAARLCQCVECCINGDIEKRSRTSTYVLTLLLRTQDTIINPHFLLGQSELRPSQLPAAGSHQGNGKGRTTILHPLCRDGKYIRRETGIVGISRCSQQETGDLRTGNGYCSHLTVLSMFSSLLGLNGAVSWPYFFRVNWQGQSGTAVPTVFCRSAHLQTQVRQLSSNEACGLVLFAASACKSSKWNHLTQFGFLFLPSRTDQEKEKRINKRLDKGAGGKTLLQIPKLRAC